MSWTFDDWQEALSHREWLKGQIEENEEVSERVQDGDFLFDDVDPVAERERLNARLEDVEQCLAEMQADIDEMPY